MKSRNMNYKFNVEYYEGIDNLLDTKKNVSSRTREIVNHTYGPTEGIGPGDCDDIKQMEGYSSFCLHTTYPGLLIGTGNPHELSMEGAIKCGFSFDYVTGLPYIPGSSLKGMIRSVFPEKKGGTVSDEKSGLIAGILKEIDPGRDFSKQDIISLAGKIFDAKNEKGNTSDGVVFLGAYPVIGNTGGRILEEEFITPHNGNVTSNPNPISIMKVRPDVEFCFEFLISKKTDGLSRKNISDLFKQIILLGGAGAKTNLGFGAFSETIKVVKVPEGSVGTSEAGTGNKNGRRPDDTKFGKKTDTKEEEKRSSDIIRRLADLNNSNGHICPICKKNKCSKNGKGVYFEMCKECFMACKKKKSNG